MRTQPAVDGLGSSPPAPGGRRVPCAYHMVSHMSVIRVHDSGSLPISRANEQGMYTGRESSTHAPDKSVRSWSANGVLPVLVPAWPADGPRWSSGPRGCQASSLSRVHRRATKQATYGQTVQSPYEAKQAPRHQRTSPQLHGKRHIRVLERPARSHVTYPAGCYQHQAFHAVFSWQPTALFPPSFRHAMQRLWHALWLACFCAHKGAMSHTCS